MTSSAEQRRVVPSDGEAILNALPNPVLLIGPDGKIVDANIAAESFFEISTQFLQRQSLKELVPFGSPLLALIDQVRASGSPVNEYKVDLGTPRIGGDRQVDLHVAPLTERPAKAALRSTICSQPNPASANRRACAIDRMVMYATVVSEDFRQTEVYARLGAVGVGASRREGRQLRLGRHGRAATDQAEQGRADADPPGAGPCRR